MADVTAVVVTYNSAGEIAACLDAVLQWTPSVVVVDNASRDTTCAVASTYPVQLIRNSSNLGFAAAVNQGFEQAATPFVLVLNPDATVLDGRDELLAAAEAGASAGLLVSEDGTPQTGFTVRQLPTATALIFECLGLNRLWPGNATNRRWRCLDLDLTKPQDVQQPAGAFLMVRRDVWRSLGGFHEGFYPVWFEDVDFCARLLAAGYRIRFTPTAKAYHQGAHSVGQLAWLDKQLYWYQNLTRYAWRRFSPPAALAVTAAAVLGGCLRACVNLLTIVSLAVTGTGNVSKVEDGDANPDVDGPHNSVNFAAKRHSKDTGKRHLHVP
ncbi:MAG: glycosyltransferase family 2 protein [Acidobacteria bacterium]|nr:glycosyltransferase family 2 protein [Acidobacteriota bacterium]